MHLDRAQWRDALPGDAELSSCPDAERLAALVLGEAAGKDRELVVDHMLHCARCAEGYRILCKLHDAASSKARAWRPLAALVAIAATLIVGTLALRLASRGG